MKKQVTVSILFFLLGIGIMYWYSGKEITYKAKASKLIISGFAQENVLDKKMINNYADSLQLLWSCVNNKSTCDLTKFDELTKEKVELDKEKQKILVDLKDSASRVQQEKMWPIQR